MQILGDFLAFILKLVIPEVYVTWPYTTFAWSNFLMLYTSPSLSLFNNEDLSNYLSFSPFYNSVGLFLVIFKWYLLIDGVIKVFLWLDKFSFNKKLLSPLYKHRFLVNRFYLTFICLMCICIPNYIFYLSWYLKRKENNCKDYSQLYIIDDTSIFWMNIFIVLIVIYLVKFKDDIIPSDPLTLEKKAIMLFFRYSILFYSFGY